ncbi:MAG: biotin--[acetyl-CoA-carboxylase] ligase [Thermodesulforhabdaceae bacterium]
MSDQSLIEILRIFKSSPDKELSGEELALRFGITRTAVWKKIQKLEELGYVFEKKPKQGYQLISVPDLLHPVEILSELKTSWFAKRYFYYREIDSTNTEAMKLAMEEGPEGIAVVAESQTAGRGRLGRSWVSQPKKGLYFSFVLRPSIEPREASQLTLLTALALVETLQSLYKIPAMVKWPNDIVVEGKKIAGILAEAHMEPQKLKFVVVGVGVNVFYSQEDFVGNFRYTPTSISIELKNSPAFIRRQDILVSFGKTFEEFYETFLISGWQPWIEKLRKASMLLGKFVTINTGREKISGTAVDFSTTGGLILKLPSGGVQEIWIGDVEQVTWE